MAVFEFEANDFGERFKEFVSWVDYQLEIELFDDVCLFLKNLVGSVLVCAAGYKLFEWRNLISFFKLSTDKESSDANELQLAEQDLLFAEVLIDEADDGEDGFGEHFEFEVQLAEPVNQLASFLFGNGFVRRKIVW